MTFKKESLWYIPLFCFAAGIFCNSILMRFEALLFASENQGNNTIYFYTTRLILQKRTVLFRLAHSRDSCRLADLSSSNR